MATRRGPYQVLSSREVYRNPWIEVREDRVIHPGGREGIFGVIEAKPGSSVLPISGDGLVWLVREFKYAAGKDSLEVISGGIEPGESPLETARRELREETGIEAGEWIEMGFIDPFTTHVRSPNHLFVARDLRHGPHEREAGELLEIVTLPLVEAVDMVLGGKITHAASCVLLLRAASLAGATV